MVHYYYEKIRTLELKAGIQTLGGMLRLFFSFVLNSVS